MAIDNYFIADQFSLLSKLMDIHGENAFKTKSYSIAAFTIEKLPEQLSAMDKEKIFSIKGIGDAIGKKILAILETGELSALTELIQKTPPGVIEMLSIKGIGPKKIATIWKEMDIESIGELLYACNENRLMLYKGFGEKTQKNIKETIEFYLRSQGSYLYAEAEPYMQALTDKLGTAFPTKAFEATGEYKRQQPIINQLELVTTASVQDIRHFMEANEFSTDLHGDDIVECSHSGGVRILFHCTSPDHVPSRLFDTGSSQVFREQWVQSYGAVSAKIFPSEADIFHQAGLPFIPSYLRDLPDILQRAKQGPLPAVIMPGDIRAIIHSHSNWSDGSNTLEEMAAACIEKGFEYMVISDHSKSAFYANGLQEERIRQQHLHIDELNDRLAPFKIFKSIECDILNDGSLDYANGILSTFDLVIASIHSNLKMTEDKAMGRLLKAIENPYTTILGHMTGRLLLSRPGYPVDHHKIIEACALHEVVIELNAHPRRLDIGWEWIEYALEKGVLISINPDAHATEGYGDTRFGVLAGQKALLTKERNLSSFTLPAFEAFLKSRKKSRGIS